jgi:hypothetical protein
VGPIEPFLRGSIGPGAASLEIGFDRGPSNGFDRGPFGGGVGPVLDRFGPYPPPPSKRARLSSIEGPLSSNSQGAQPGAVLKGGSSGPVDLRSTPVDFPLVFGCFREARRTGERAKGLPTAPPDNKPGCGPAISTILVWIWMAGRVHSRPSRGTTREGLRAQSDKDATDHHGAKMRQMFGPEPPPTKRPELMNAG